MTKYLLLTFIGLLLFSGVDCRHNPVGPPSGADTTSNNFTFQTYTFGGNAGSCYLQDVAIISDTDIWAVGAVYLDSADGAPDPFPYNAVHWDGQKWIPLRVPYMYQGQPFYHPIEAVFALASNDVWFGGNGLEHWNGYQFSDVDAINPVWPDYTSMQRIWASSDNDIYIVGSGGTIVHYTSGTWTKISTGTDLYFNDIYGSGGQILATCLTNYSTGNWGPGIFSIQGNTATQISVNPIQYGLYGVWFVPNQHYYVADADIYGKHSLSDSAWIPLNITGTATGVRGNGTNDVFVVSASGDFLHWNGVVWKSFKAETGLSNGGYSRVAVNGSVVVAVGQNNINFGEAVITIARRQ